MKNDRWYVNVGAFSPFLKVANPEYNAGVIRDWIAEVGMNLDLMVFPELCVTGYTCADLFLQSALLDAAAEAISEIKKSTGRLYERTGAKPVVVVGAPVRKDGRLYNCAVYIQNGEIVAIVPKVNLPNYNEFYEARWFTPGKETGMWKGTPFGPNVLVKSGRMVIGTDICEDLWVPNPPSGRHVLQGANIIVNPSASNEIVSKSSYRRNLVKDQSARCICGYVYASAGMDESTTDTVFSGHLIIAENGSVKDEKRYNQSVYAKASIDLEKLSNDRRRMNDFVGERNESYLTTAVCDTRERRGNVYLGEVNPYPFVPKGDWDKKERCEEIFAIQSTGLSQRMQKTGIKKLVVGVSGGLDSTLALLVMVEAMRKQRLSMKNIIGITMPGFGTTTRTRSNAEDLMNLLDIKSECIDITPSVTQHFEDIGHPFDKYDFVYENCQARERTQILMDKANQVNGLVVGTGDLSELALGWCTYNGDHMSMYAVNTGVPKTLVKYVILSVAGMYKAKGGQKNRKIADVLYDICDTPISPELLPTGANGEMVQKTEESIGKYDLHDFFLYHMLRNGFSPSKIYFLATLAFPDVEKKTIKKTMETFYKRFFSQQFKRSCLPDGPKVGTVAVSPRGDLRMPSDACAELWLKEVKGIDIDR